MKKFDTFWQNEPTSNFIKITEISVHIKQAQEKKSRNIWKDITFKR